MYRWLSLLLIFGLLHQGLRGPEFMQRAKQGFGHMRNLDYDQAERLFLSLKEEYPAHPAPPRSTSPPYSGCGSCSAARISTSIDSSLPLTSPRAAGRKSPRGRSRNFSGSSRKARSGPGRSSRRIPKNWDARYFLDAASGILGSFSFTIERSVKKAFDHGKKAYQYDQKVIEEDPAYYDAYMTVGTYEYIVGSLPWYIKWFAALIGYRGSKERGFEYLSLAVERGQYVADDARVLKMVLLVREERYEEVLAEARTLHRGFPRSYLFHLNVFQILEKLGKSAEAAEELRAILDRSESSVPNYQMLSLAKFRYSAGQKFLNLGNRELAEEQFRKAWRTPARRSGKEPCRISSWGSSSTLVGSVKERFGTIRRFSR